MLKISLFSLQLTEAGLSGVTGHDARRPVEQAIKFEQEPAPIRFHSTEGRIARDQWNRTGLAKKQNTALVSIND